MKSEQLLQSVCEEERNSESRRDKQIEKENTRIEKKGGFHQDKFESDSDSDPEIFDLKYAQAAILPAIMRRMTSAKVYTNLNPVSQEHWSCPTAAEFEEIAPHYPWEEEEDADILYSMKDDVAKIMNLDETIEMHTHSNVQITRSMNVSLE
uniref:Uncharacterized protein n=1 Tax=Caenorhabditis japonica TaxID=281687 RepID=A0A8R1EPT0_CAEJA